jgi:cytoskeletal protein CcmA (bactofilin family)
MNDPKKKASAAESTTQRRTLVAEGTHFKGALKSTFPILVQGSLEGEVDGPAVGVAATGVLSGRIAATALKSDGRIAGRFDVDTAEVSGSVARDTVVRASSLELRLDAPRGKLEIVFGSGTHGKTS